MKLIPYKPLRVPPFRLVCLSIAVIMLLSPLSAFAIPQQQGGSTAITSAKKIPSVKGYSIDPTAGQAPINVSIEVVASGATQMKVENEHGERLLGSESFSRDASNNSIFKLTAAFSSGYEGMLYIYLKSSDGQWVKADADFSVRYADPPKPTATPTPTPSPAPTPKPTAVPTPTPEPDDFIYEKTSGSTWAIAGYTGNEKNVKIPLEYLGQKVTAIASGAFYRCTTLREVTLSDNITSIGSNAFENCYDLEKIRFTYHLTTIGDEAFLNCSSLREISLPEGLQMIGSKAFYSCKNLAKITLPQSVRSIGSNAFSRKYIEYSGSDRREVNMPIDFYVTKNSYAADYVKTYHSHDNIHSGSSSSSVPQPYSRYGAKLKGATICWIEKADLDKGIKPWNATRNNYRTVSKSKFAQLVKTYRLYCKTDFTYTQDSQYHTFSEELVLRSPSGKFVTYQGSNSLEGNPRNTPYFWYNPLEDLIRRMCGKNVPDEIGTYTLELYFDGQLVGSASFALTN